MEDFYEGLIDPPSGINPLTDNGVVPWSILLAPSGPPRTALGRFPSQRAEARERERQQFAAIDDPGERAADRMRTSAKPAGGREEGNMTVFADHIVPYVQSRISHLAELPQRAIGESHRYALTGDYDIGPALESATLPMAGTFFAGARGVGAGPTRPPRTHPADAMGFRRDMPIEFSIVPEGEKLAAAAIDVNGRIVTARTHAEAALKAEKILGMPVEQMTFGAIPDGFVTTTGRYVSRWEGTEMGKRAGQGEATGVFGATRGLAAENTEMAPLGSAPKTRVRVGATATGLDGGEGIWGVLKPSRWKGRGALWHRADNPANLNAKNVPGYRIQEALNSAWDQGHDAVRITNYIRPGGTEPETIIVVRHPNQLRRPTAKFDPAKRDSSDLLAGIAGGAMLGGSFIRDREE